MSFRLYQSVYTLIIMIALSIVAGACGSAQKKEKDNLEKIHEQAQKGDKKSWENYEKALESAKEEKNPELQEKIINDIASIHSKESVEILKKEAGSELPETRSAALKGLYEQSKDAKNSETIKQETVEIIKSNSELYDGLNSTDVKILGEIKNDNAIDLLIEALKKQPHNDEALDTEIVQTLASILADQKKQLSDMASSENPDVEKKASLEASSAKIEKALLDLIKSDTSKSLKEKTLFELYNAYVPDSRKKFLEMYKSSEYDEDVKLMILGILGYRENPENNEILKSLKEEYLKTENSKEHERILNRINALIPNEFNLIKIELEKNMTLILRKKEIKSLAAKGQVFMLKSILKKYNIPGIVVDRIQTSLEELSRDTTTPMKAEAVILFSSVQTIYQNKNYFEIKKAAEKGLHIPGLFLTMLNSIDREFAAYDMKILTIRSVWKINELEAVNIYKAYLGEKNLLRELLK